MGVEALTAIFTAISVSVLVLSRIVEHYAFGKKNDGVDETRVAKLVEEAVDKMKDVILRTDDDGTPLVYTPRSVARHQADIMETQRRIATSIELQTKLLERLETKITS